MAFVEKRELPRLTEAMVQELLATRAQQRKHELIVPNTGVAFGWESDLISVMKSGSVHEYEIKTSRADWLAELRKARAEVPADLGHGGHRRSPNVKSMRHNHLMRAKEFERIIKSGKHHPWGGYMVDGYYSRDAGPNYFWLVTAVGVTRPDELPEYAGLIEVGMGATAYRLLEIKAAPRLHGLKAGDRTMTALARGLSLRYWEARRLEAQRRG